MSKSIICFINDSLLRFFIGKIEDQFVILGKIYIFYVFYKIKMKKPRKLKKNRKTQKNKNIIYEICIICCLN